MLGFSHIADYARKWRADQKRIAMENTLMDLPAELRKDIGWPAARDCPSAARTPGDIHARPML